MLGIHVFDQALQLNASVTHSVRTSPPSKGLSVLQMGESLLDFRLIHCGTHILIIHAAHCLRWSLQPQLAWRTYYDTARSWCLVHKKQIDPLPMRRAIERRIAVSMPALYLQAKYTPEPHPDCSGCPPGPCKCSLHVGGDDVVFSCLCSSSSVMCMHACSMHAVSLQASTMRAAMYMHAWLTPPVHQALRVCPWPWPWSNGIHHSSIPPPAPTCIIKLKYRPLLAGWLQEWFELVDDDGSGQLDKEELDMALKASGIPASEQAIQEMIE